MSDEPTGTPGAPESQPEPEATPEVYTRQEVDALIDEATSKAAKMAFESVQGYTDKREKELQAKVDTAVEGLVAAGIEATPEVKLQLRNKFRQGDLSPTGDEEAQVPMGQGYPPPQAQVPELPPHIQWAQDKLLEAGVPPDAKELNFGPDDPQFFHKIEAVAEQYKQASAQTETDNQETPPPTGPVEARMPTGSTAGASVGGGTLEQQYERAMAKAKKENPYLSTNEKLNIRKEWRDKGANI